MAAAADYSAVPVAPGPGYTAVGQPRLTWAVRPDGRPLPYAQHVHTFGGLPTAASTLITAADAARLAGRGGAGFPTGTKLRTAAEAAGRSRRRGRSQPLVVANGAEGEPASAKDRLLLTRVPHLVLDGGLLAAAAIGADRVVLRVHDSPPLVQTLRRAIAERPAGEAGALEVATTAPRYLAGESSAVVGELDGGPAVPRFSLEPAARRGVGGRPTVVLNVETLADLALLARFGPDWYRTVGTPYEPGTVLVTVGVPWSVPVVVEAPLGSPVGEVLAAAGAPAGAASHVLTGGYGGRWVPWDRVIGAPLSRAGLAAVGGVLGAGVLAVLPATACGLVETAPIVRYLAQEGAGQCGPCLNGLPAIAGAMAALATGDIADTTVDRLLGWCGQVDGRGACHHPDGVVTLVRSTITEFADEVRRHRGQGWCGRPYQRVLPVGPRKAAE
jgi:NADH:ubiquinone oxidoreductase subunit F (NADH-binding)